MTDDDPVIVPFAVTGADPLPVGVRSLTDLGHAVRLDVSMRYADWLVAEEAGAFLLDLVSEGLTEDGVDVSLTLVLRPAFARGRDATEIAAVLLGGDPGTIARAEAWLLLEATQAVERIADDGGATLSLGFRTPWSSMLDG